VPAATSASGPADAWPPAVPAADLVIVDEASMLDLDLAAALVAAVPASAELMLVGDAGQLAAVEAGAVFAEACSHAWPADFGPVHEQLTGSRRYADGSPIAHLAEALRRGDAQAATQCGDALLLGRPSTPERFDEALAVGLAPYLASLRDPGATPAMLLAARRGFLVLAGRHGGPAGVTALNRRIGLWLQRQCGRTPSRDPDAPWPGRAVIVLRNDPATGLANGDTGVLWPGPAGWLAWFDDGPQHARAVAAERLPPHADAFAMTVHKAQGSEADTVLVLLPEPALARREWLYTAVTRARRTLWLAGEPASLAQAALRPAARDGGLRQRLDEASRAPAAPASPP
jgi:exodeoxyribonuclease V alpha subunit